MRPLGRHPRRAHPRLPGIALGLALALLGPAGAPRAQPAAPDALSGVASRYVPLGDRSWGLLSLPARAAGAAGLPAVVLLGDGVGPDGRMQSYAVRLLSLGVAVLDADDDALVSNDTGLVPRDALPTRARLAAAGAVLRGLPEVDPSRIAVIAVGADAHGILADLPAWRGAVAAAALLYPGCAEAPARFPAAHDASAQARLLLVHGDADPAAAAACERLAESLGGAAAGATRYLLRGAGLGWDLDGASGRGDSLLVDPARPAARLRAVPDPQRALIALDRILLFLGEVLGLRDRAP